MSPSLARELFDDALSPIDAAHTSVTKHARTEIPLSAAGEAETPHAETLSIDIPAPAPDTRDNLSQFIMERVHMGLVRRGASPHGSGHLQNLTDAVTDTLHRAQCLGAKRLRLRFASLDAIARAGALSVTDSRTLRWWLRASPAEVEVELPSGSSRLRVYLEPVSLALLLDDDSAGDAAGASSTDSTPDTNQPDDTAGTRKEQTTNSSRDEASAAETRADDQHSHYAQSDGERADDRPTDIRQLVLPELWDAETEPPVNGEVDSFSGVHPLDGELADPDVTPGADMGEVLARAGASDLGKESADVESADVVLRPPVATAQEFDAPDDGARTSQPDDGAALDLVALLGWQPDETPTTPPVAALAPVSTTPETTHDGMPKAEPIAPNDLGDDAISDVVARVATKAGTSEEEAPHVTRWREGLRAAEGVQSWDGLERLFIANYLPLVHLIADGSGTPGMEHDTRTWAADFELCYASAFEHLRRGATRPTMLLDVPQLAQRWTRELDAENLELVLVDGMRFDVGQCVHDKLRLQLSDVAQCVQRGVLWAALPSTTAIQLELLARGSGGLRQLTGDLDESPWRTHGAEARKLRKLRVGSYHVHKLDVLQSEFDASDWNRDERESAAAEVAVSAGRFIRQQAKKTLVLVFGDHGLTGDGEPSASPENVLVPLDAWYVEEQ